MCDRFVGGLRILLMSCTSFLLMSGRFLLDFSGFWHVGKSDVWVVGAVGAKAWQWARRSD